MDLSREALQKSGFPLMRLIFRLHFMQSAEGKENQNEIHLKSSHLPPQAVQYTAEHIIMPCVFSPNRLFIGGASLEDRGAQNLHPLKSYRTIVSKSPFMGMKALAGCIPVGSRFPFRSRCQARYARSFIPKRTGADGSCNPALRRIPHARSRDT